jgi:DHA2 family multidrug resistance protein
VIAHASLTERVTSANPAWNNSAVASAYDVHSAGGAAFLDGAVTQQAAMIAYIDDFWLMLFLTVLVMPLLLLIRPPRGSGAAGVDTQAVMD